VRALLQIHTVDTMDQVLERALEQPIPKLAADTPAAESQPADEPLHQ
jgi:hypothetical protein